MYFSVYMYKYNVVLRFRVVYHGISQESLYFSVYTQTLTWLKTVPALSKTYILMGHYYHSLSVDATIIVSKNCPIIGEHVGNIFVTQ